jgi:hypothetical protein
MPIRKPRRNPKATAQALEALFFPEIIDTIFENAPRASLLVLRRVCKNWRHRADRCLVRHVFLPFQTGPDEERRPRVIPDGKFPRANWHRTKMAESSGCIDLRESWLAPPWVSRLPGVEVIRHQWWPSRRSALCIRSSEPGRPLRLVGSPSGCAPATTLAFSLMSDRFELPDFNMLLLDGLPGTSLTVIAIAPLPATLEQSPWLDGLVLDRLGRFLGHHLTQAYHRGASFSVTLVNLSSWYNLLVYRRNFVFDGRCLLQSSHFTTTLLEGEERPCKSDDDVRAKVGPYVAHSIPQEARTRLLKEIAFLSLDEYRDKVGDAQLKFETERVD